MADPYEFLGEVPTQQTPVAAPQAAPGTQMSGMLRYPALAGSSFVKGAEEGVGGIVDLLRRYMDQREPPQFNTLTPFGQAMQGSYEHRIGAAGEGELTPQLLQASKQLGLTDRPDLVPQNMMERYLQAGAEGAGSAAPFALVPGAGPGLMLASGAGGGLGAQAAREAFPDSQVAPMIGGAVGGMGVGGLHSLVTGGQLERAAASLGQSSTMQEAGEYVQDRARQWLQNEMPQRMQSIWAPVDATMQGADTPLTNFENTLKGLKTKGGSLQDVVDEVMPSASNRVSNILGALQKTPSTGLGLAPKWEEVQYLRSTLGNIMKDPSVVKDIPAKQLDALYKSLTEDMKSAAGAKGQAASDLFNNANAESSKLFQFAEGHLSKVVAGAKPSASDPTPESVATKLLTSAKKGGTDLAALRGEMPDAVDELAAAHIRSPKIEWGKLSPEGQAALVSDPGLRRAIDNAAKVYPKVPTSPSALANHALYSLAGEGAGHALSILAAHVAGSSPETSLVPGAMGDLLGLSAPFIYRGAVGLARNPLAAVPTLVGGAAGATSGQKAP